MVGERKVKFKIGGLVFGKGIRMLAGNKSKRLIVRKDRKILV